MSARVELAPLFYSFKHPKYQQLHLRDYVKECKGSIQQNLTLRNMKVFQFQILVTVVKVVILSKRKLLKPSNRFYRLGCHHQKSGKEFVEKLRL